MLQYSPPPQSIFNQSGSVAKLPRLAYSIQVFFCNSKYRFAVGTVNENGGRYSAGVKVNFCPPSEASAAVPGHGKCILIAQLLNRPSNISFSFHSGGVVFRPSDSLRRSLSRHYRVLLCSAHLSSFML